MEVRDLHRARQVLAVIELVSSGNKDDEEAREIFSGSCLSYLAKGIELVVIDIVSDRLANLRNDVVRLAGHEAKCRMPGDPPLDVSAYRPVHAASQDSTIANGTYTGAAKPRTITN